MPIPPTAKAKGILGIKTMKFIPLEGKYNKAKIFTDNVDNKAISQVFDLLNEEFTKESKIRFMPDIHPGAGCVIGTTMTITDKIVPNLVGFDLSCGIITVNLGKEDIDLKSLDNYIRENIPFGQSVHSSERTFDRLDRLKCINHIDKSRALKSIGTLGGGNHYVEVGREVGGDNTNILTIHTGSRYLGKQIAEYYQDLAIKRHSSNKEEIDKLIETLKSQGRHSEIEKEIQKIKPKKINNQLAYLEGQDMLDYLHDVDIAQVYASKNRKAIANSIINFLYENISLDNLFHFETVHNYIDSKRNILRKGAVSAEKDEIILIPINMRDGSILAKGKGNPDWNYSAPHGAGRLFSRGQAKDEITLEQFEESMKGVYSTSVREDTIDESAFAYKSIDEIMENTKDTLEILKIIKPIYNFKA